MRLVHVSDLHLGFRQFQRQTPRGINQREADVATVFRGVVDHIIQLRPDLVCIAGDVFHHVRPSNPAIVDAFNQLSRLTRALPDAAVVMVAGNHDTPRTAETGCILRLFTQLGIHIVDEQARRISFPEHGLAVLAVPDNATGRTAFHPDPAFRYNVLIAHCEVEGILPTTSADAERSALQVSVEELGINRWNYVALGHYHVFRQIKPNEPHAVYSGAIDYTSTNIWGEWAEERAAKLPGKIFVEFDLATGRRKEHKIHLERELVDLPVLSGKGRSAADLDAAIRTNVARAGGIDDKIVRQVITEVPRHVLRELDHKALRELMRRALHFHVDARRPEIVRSSASGAPGRRPSLTETVRDRLRSRVLPADVDREALVELGLRYLRDADTVESASLPIAAESE